MASESKTGASQRLRASFASFSTTYLLYFQLRDQPVYLRFIYQHSDTCDLGCVDVV